MDKDELVKRALKRAFLLGQTYWQQADSPYTSQHKKADETLLKLGALKDETVAALTTPQPGVREGMLRAA
jgi:hypothetical protein